MESVDDVGNRKEKAWRKVILLIPGDMPRISEFFGIIIAMYFNDHSPPHFHAIYGEHEAKFSIQTLEIIDGTLPRRALSLVLEWATLHRPELMTNWNRARRGVQLKEIEPLL